MDTLVMTRRLNENVIPWSQIKPLLKPGMTAQELNDAVLDRLGLPRDRYLTQVAIGAGETAIQAIRREGIRVVSVEQETARQKAGEKLDFIGAEMIGRKPRRKGKGR